MRQSTLLKILLIIGFIACPLATARADCSGSASSAIIQVGFERLVRDSEAMAEEIETLFLNRKNETEMNAASLILDNLDAKPKALLAAVARTAEQGNMGVLQVLNYILRDLVMESGVPMTYEKRESLARKAIELVAAHGTKNSLKIINHFLRKKDTWLWWSTGIERAARKAKATLTR